MKLLRGEKLPMARVRGGARGAVRIMD